MSLDAHCIPVVLTYPGTDLLNPITDDRRFSEGKNNIKTCHISHCHRRSSAVSQRCEALCDKQLQTLCPGQYHHMSASMFLLENLVHRPIRAIHGCGAVHPSDFEMQKICRPPPDSSRQSVAQLVVWSITVLWTQDSFQKCIRRYEWQDSTEIAWDDDGSDGTLCFDSVEWPTGRPTNYPTNWRAIQLQGD